MSQKTAPVGENLGLVSMNASGQSDGPVGTNASEVIGIEGIKKNQMLQARSVKYIHGHKPHLIYN